MTRKIISKLAIALTISSASSIVSAHHGASPYDGEVTATVTGTVTEFRFTNPHVLIYIDVEGENGEVVNWSGELTSPNRLARAAMGTVKWSRDILQPGDVIELTGNPARNGAPQLRLRQVVDSNGTAMIGGGGGSSADIVVARAPVGPVVDTEVGDLTGVYMRADRMPYSNYAFSDEPPAMTAWAEDRYEASRPTFGPRGVAVADTNDPVYECLPPGTPRIYFHPRPFEIIQTEGRVLISYEYQALLRAIYTDGRPHREDLAASWMGDSIGRWENGTLIVETTNLNDRTWVDRRGLPHSDEMRVEERIHLATDGTLIVDVTVEDPVAFTESWSGRLTYSPTNWTIEEFVCLDNESFDDFEQILLEYEE